MLQQEKPDDFVIATGRQESVRRFIELSARELNWDRDGNNPIIWQGNGLEEVGLRADTKEIVIRVDPRYFRPSEVETLLGNPLKAKEKLNWSPKTTLEELVKEMMDNDIKKAEEEVYYLKNFTN